MKQFVDLVRAELGVLVVERTAIHHEYAQAFVIMEHFALEISKRMEEDTLESFLTICDAICSELERLEYHDRVRMVRSVQKSVLKKSGIPEAKTILAAIELRS